jgi:hypothetical protein
VRPAVFGRLNVVNVKTAINWAEVVTSPVFFIGQPAGFALVFCLFQRLSAGLSEVAAVSGIVCRLFIVVVIVAVFRTRIGVENILPALTSRHPPSNLRFLPGPTD